MLASSADSAPEVLYTWHRHASPQLQKKRSLLGIHMDLKPSRHSYSAHTLQVTTHFINRRMYPGWTFCPSLPQLLLLSLVGKELSVTGSGIYSARRCSVMHLFCAI